MNTALVTGFSGQDGSYLTEMLLQRGWTVHGVSHQSEGLGRLKHPRLEVHSFDLSQSGIPRRLVLDMKPDVVYNLAAISSVARSWETPAETGRVNGVVAAEFLESIWMARESQGRNIRFIQASSAEIFGEADSSPQNEETPIQPASPYGVAKAYAHRLVSLYRQRGLFASNAILYNHESPRRPQTFVTRKITSQVAKIAMGAEDKLVLGNLDAARDWGWAPDYVNAMFLMAEAKAPGDFVIATGQSHTVRDFVAASFEYAGISDWESHVVVDDRYSRPSDTAEMRGDYSKALQILGWEPSLSFHDVVARMTRHDLATHQDCHSDGSST